jgi:hypothetical protein
MKKILLFVLCLSAFHVPAEAARNWSWWQTQQNRRGGRRVPYFAQFREGGRIIVFHGYVLLANEPRINVMQTHFLENLNDAVKAEYFRQELYFLGVEVQEVPDDPSVPSENIQHHYPPSQAVH